MASIRGSSEHEVSSVNSIHNEEVDATEEVNENRGNRVKFPVKIAINDLEDLCRIRFELIPIEDIIRYHFPDTQMAFLFYNCYAGQHGFAASKSRVVWNCNGEKIQQTFVCHREGVKEKKTVKKRKRAAKKGGSKPIIRCECRARMQVHIDEGSGKWYIKYLHDDHNHSLLDSNFRGMLPTHRKMSEYDKYLMTSMRDVGIKTSDIYRYAASQAGGFDKVGLSKRDMYNELTNQRSGHFSDAKEALDYLNDLCLTNSKMFWKHTVDSDGHLEKLFWCDGVSRMDYSVFSDVIAFDATYRKLRYLCPLVVFSGVNHHNQSIIFAAAIVVNESIETYVWLLK